MWDLARVKCPHWAPMVRNVQQRRWGSPGRPRLPLGATWQGMPRPCLSSVHLMENKRKERLQIFGDLRIFCSIQHNSFNEFICLCVIFACIYLHIYYIYIYLALWKKEISDITELSPFGFQKHQNFYFHLIALYIPPSCYSVSSLIRWAVSNIRRQADKCFVIICFVFNVSIHAVIHWHFDIVSFFILIKFRYKQDRSGIMGRAFGWAGKNSLELCKFWVPN